MAQRATARVLQRGPIAALAHEALAQPIAVPVPADDARFAEKGRLRLAYRVARLHLQLRLSGQHRTLQTRFDPAWRRALWIHAEAPQIGDALMDLAPRTLLTEHGIALDLLATGATAGLFRGDAAFGQVFDDESALDPADYDVVIVDSWARRALAAKQRRLPALPWLAIRNAYLGYDFQRGLLATRRLADVLGVALDDSSVARHARQKLILATEAHSGPVASASAGHSVAFAMGGVHAERSYAHWADVARGLPTLGVCTLLLVGSANGRAAADALVQVLDPQLQVDDRVGRTSLHATRQAIAQADLLLCADGGLMHLGLTTATPLVALFDSSVDPAWRLPLDFDGAALRATVRDVSAISPQAVLAAAAALLARRPAKHPAD